MSRRVQLSLLFEDQDLYEGMILPWKANRELSPLVIKLLTAYFYSDDVRELVDCYGEEEIVCEGVSSSFEESIANARDTLAFMNMLTEGAKNVLADGIEDINQIASATGGKPSEETDFGMSLPSFKSSVHSTDNSQEAASEVPSKMGERVESLEKQLGSVISTLSDLSLAVQQLVAKGASSETEVKEVFVEDSTHVEYSEGSVEDNDTSKDDLSSAIEESDTVESKDADFVAPPSDFGISEDIDLSTVDDVVAPPSEVVESLEKSLESLTGDETVEDSSSDDSVEGIAPDIHDEETNTSNVSSGDVETGSDSENVKDGSDSLLAFLNNGVGFSVEL